MARTPHLRWALLVVLAAAPEASWADGAFPDSFGLFAPPDQPHRLMLATNFGVVVSVDDGQTWNIICEIGMLSINTFIYQVGAAPSHPLLGISLTGLAYSRDEGCTWGTCDGGIPSTSIQDAFPDPSDASHVLAVAQLRDGGGYLPEGLYESHDTGASFSNAALYLAPSSSFITGVEISASVPTRYYATVYTSSATYHPYIVRSDDQGAHWTTYDQGPALGQTSLRLAAVDPQNADRLFLRLVDSQGHEALGVATDGGFNTAVPIRLPTTPNPFAMSAFLLSRDGRIWIGTRPGPGGYRSDDNGATFVPAFPHCHIKAMAQSDAGIVLATDNGADGFAVGISPDGLGDCTPDGGVISLLTYQGICDLEQCGNIPTACANWWANQQKILGTPPTVCGRIPPDAGSPADAGQPTADGGPGPPAKSGCGYGVHPGAATLVALGALLGASLLRRRRRTT